MAIEDRVNSINSLVESMTARFDVFVRAAMAFMLVGTLFWLEWHSPDPLAYVPPGSLLGVAGLVTGYYLTGNASLILKGIFSMAYVAMFSAFVLRLGWAPEFIVGQVTVVMGIFYGQRAQAAKVIELKTALATATNGNGNGTTKPQATPSA